MSVATAKPNILILMTDQQRADTMGCAGHPTVQTPHMDRIAGEGALKDWEPYMHARGFPGPHDPWDAPKESFDRYDPEKTPEPIPYSPPRHDAPNFLYPTILDLAGCRPSERAVGRSLMPLLSEGTAVRSSVLSEVKYKGERYKYASSETSSAARTTRLSSASWQHHIPSRNI